ncbi:MAG: hypothetical protein UT12_C0004G0017 [Candidatus Curtissbacteria bacterium GW2011_GWC2_38_9]|uniref:Uncharacterized protein n=1 Tax=Candidatus Curtissbacteria bacterium GW2011_GWC2_38_9 TaxID=1618414 RepID=A0A0G0LFZ2_9BACT|nr:MAG: hypothetical protein UT12_C0004G0017 [Candidatus Curtissbacteria bacterium GW2011_GWC2_38_9]
MQVPSTLGRFFKKKSPELNNYLSLTLTPNEVLACIWTFNLDNKVEILGFGQREFTNVDSLIHQAAVAIDAAGEMAKSDVSQTVFGLSYYWFENGEPSVHATKVLKNLASDLELDPQAFISLASSLNHLLKSKESVTPQAVIIGIFEDFCEVHLIKNNKVVTSQTSKSPISAQKIVGLVGRLKEESQELPSRIIVFGANESSDIFQKLSAVNWHDIFVHEPKIDIVSDEDLAKSVAYAQAQDILGYEPTIGSDTKGKKEIKESIAEASGEFGFIEGEDILLDKGDEESDRKMPPLEQKPDEDLIKKPHAFEKEEYAVEIDSTAASPAEAESAEKPDFGEQLATVAYLPKIFGFLKKRPPLKNLLIAVAILLIIFLIGSFVAAQTLTEAKIRIKVNAKPQESNFNVSAASGGSFDQDRQQIAAEEISAQASGNQKAVATGSKKLGEKAHGEVTVLNWTTSPKDFPSQTVILSKDGLKFTLDADIAVASRSASTPGQSKVTVKAVEVGPNGNIDAGNDFTFQQFDDLLYSARNDLALTDGAERQVTVVSQEDQDRLNKSLTDLLTDKAKQDLMSKASGKKLADEAIVVKVLKKAFDKKIDEEASLVNLDMEVEASAIVYDENDLKKLLAESITNLPENLEARPENVEITKIDSQRKNDTLSLSGRFQAELVPKFNEDELRGKIAGKSVKEIRAIIKEVPEVTDVIVEFSPNIPLFNPIPRNKSKIKFAVEAS